MGSSLAYAFLTFSPSLIKIRAVVFPADKQTEPKTLHVPYLEEVIIMRRRIEAPVKLTVRNQVAGDTMAAQLARCAKVRK